MREWKKQPSSTCVELVTLGTARLACFDPSHGLEIRANHDELTARHRSVSARSLVSGIVQRDQAVAHLCATPFTNSRSVHICYGRSSSRHGASDKPTFDITYAL